jgi:hypothetical protein
VAAEWKEMGAGRVERMDKEGKIKEKYRDREFRYFSTLIQ